MYKLLQECYNTEWEDATGWVLWEGVLMTGWCSSFSLWINIPLYRRWCAKMLHELTHSHGLGFTLALHTVFSLHMVLHINPCGWLSNEGRFNTVYSKLANIGNSLHGWRGWPAKDREVFHSPTGAYSSKWSILPWAIQRSERDPTHITTDEREKWTECRQAHGVTDSSNLK